MLPASSHKQRKSDSRQRNCGKAFVVFALALAMLPCTWDPGEGHTTLLTGSLLSDSDVAVLAPTNVESPEAADTLSSLPNESDTQPISQATCALESTEDLSLVELPVTETELLPSAVAPQARHDTLDMIGDSLARGTTSSVDLLSFARKKTLPNFATAYRALLKRIAMLGLPRLDNPASLSHTTIIGTISTYNPYRDGREEGGPQTASGEPYDPTAWTAAIKTELRKNFGGVRYGRLYQPTYALVQSGSKQLIVKINDVGPLKPGRVLDLNERSMRHFDPFLTRGLLKEATITLLPGNDWTPGPVGVAYAIDLVRAEPRPMIAELGPDTTTLPADSELERWRAPLGHAASTIATSSHAAVAAIR